MATVYVRYVRTYESKGRKQVDLATTDYVEAFSRRAAKMDHILPPEIEVWEDGELAQVYELRSFSAWNMVYESHKKRTKAKMTVKEIYNTFYSIFGYDPVLK